MPINKDILETHVTPFKDARAGSPLPVISQLSPFNDARFDAAIALLSRKHNRPLSKYEIVKLHVLMDVFHVLESGSPVIGGHVEPWDLGPVVDEAYNRLESWCSQFEYGGTAPENFNIENDGKLRYLWPTFNADPDDFSPSELAAMEKAWNLLIPMMDKGYAGYLEAMEYFHSDKTFIGRAYNMARADGRREMDWNEIIDCYDRLNGTDHSALKMLLQL